MGNVTLMGCERIRKCKFDGVGWIWLHRGPYALLEGDHHGGNAIVTFTIWKMLHYPWSKLEPLWGRVPDTLANFPPPRARGRL